jgi:hypothetical protein
VSRPGAATGWEIHHWPYDSARERRALLLSLAERWPERRWWWADVALPAPALEVGVASEDAGSGSALILQPGLFPGGRVPDWYPVALSDTARAAVAILAAHSPGGEPVPWDAVRTELSRLYESLVPDRAQRSLVIDWHARWISAMRAPAEGAHSRERAAVVARLAHLQVVRLRGPGGADEIAREAELVRSLSGATARPQAAAS